MYIIHVASKALFTEEIKTGFYGANIIQRGVLFIVQTLIPIIW